MSNSISSGKRLQLLFKQHFIHNAQLLLLSTMAYVGVIFIILTIAQVADDLHPHRLDNFQAYLIAFVTVFSLLYVGHSFPAFRSKESTISYLMLPASTTEKFIFECLIRIAIIVVALPFLYWVTFHLQGYSFAIFTPQEFEPIGLQHLVALEVEDNIRLEMYALITGGSLFVLSVAFTGAAMFAKQPLVKTLFAVAMIVMFFVGYSYIVIEPLGVGRYNPPEELTLLPMEESGVLIFLSTALLAGAVVMLFVAFRKLKEREV